MKIRGYDKANEEIKLEMTPMIDIVFQLLVFFIMTYKVTAMEGDYNIRMPSPGAQETMQDELLEEILQVRLVANSENRFLDRIEVTYGPDQQTWRRDVYPVRREDPKVKLTKAQEQQNRESRAVFNSLNQFVINVVGGGSDDPGSASELEAEIEADTNLRYEDTVYAIEAISGYKDDNKKIIKLIEKIKFRDTSGG